MESKQLCSKWQLSLVAYSWKRWSTLPKREASAKMGQFQGQWLRLFPLDLQSAWSSKGCQGLYSKPHLLNRKRDAFKMMHFQNSGSCPLEIFEGSSAAYYLFNQKSATSFTWTWSCCSQLWSEWCRHSITGREGAGRILWVLETIFSSSTSLGLDFKLILDG